MYGDAKKVTLLADPTGGLCKAMGLQTDLSEALGDGVRYNRATIEVDEGKVTKISVDWPLAKNPTRFQEPGQVLEFTR